MKTTHYVGIDIASATFMGSVTESPIKKVAGPQSFDNDTAGFEALESWFTWLGVTPTHAILCMEATGVYGEGLAYHLTAHERWLAVAPPLQVKLAFAPIGHKTDAVDSRQIAEYAFRFQDQLHRFVPKQEIIEQVKVLLQLREQYVRQKTAHLNSLHALKRKVVTSKPKSVVINSMSNRLIRVICTVLRSRQPFIKDFVSLPLHVCGAP